MLKQLKSLLAQFASGDFGSTPHSTPEQLACALLLQLAGIDQTIDDRELKVLGDHLHRTFGVATEDLQALLQSAQMQADNATSLYEFTSQINQHCTSTQKLDIIRAMWRVALADGHLDRYEEHFIRRAAELLHVRHMEFIQAKLEIIEAT